MKEESEVNTASQIFKEKKDRARVEAGDQGDERQ